MLKKERGITLIALIITIIVMLILVGVTINVALNGGLFDKAKDAKEKTLAATEKEQLLNAVFATLDDNGKIYLENIVLPEGFGPSESSDNVFIGPSGKEYEVSKETGAITEVGEESLGEYYIRVLKCIAGMIETTEEELEQMGILYENLNNEGKFAGLEIDTGIENYEEYYYYIDGYIIANIYDTRGEEEIEDLYLMTSENEKYDKISAMLKEKLDIYKELRTLLIGYNYTADTKENIIEYIESELKKEFDFHFKSSDYFYLYYKSLIDENVTYTYTIEATDNSNSSYTIDEVTV